MTDMDEETRRYIARYDSLGSAIAGLLADSQEPPDVILNLLTNLLANVVGETVPSSQLDFAAEQIAEQVIEQARQYQEFHRA